MTSSSQKSLFSFNSFKKKITFFFWLATKFLSRFPKRIIGSKAVHNYQPKTKFSFEHYWARYKNVILIASSIAVLILGWSFRNELFKENKIYQGYIGVYEEQSLPAAVTNLLSKPLVRIDQAGQPQPELAQGWQVNNNATVYTFSLKDNIYWNDGTPVQSSQIKFSLPDVEVSYPDQKTIQFKLADSFSTLPSLLTEPIFKDDSLVGVGEYLVASKEMNHQVVTRMILQPKNLHSTLPEVFLRFYPDEKTAVTAFDLGEIDHLIGISEDKEVLAQPKVQVANIPNFNRVVAVFYNTKDPILADKNLRKALSAFTPRVDNEEKAITSIPTTSWAFNDQVRDPLQNLAAGKDYLEKVTMGKDTTITLTTTPHLAGLGEKIVRSWKQNGVQAVLRIESGIPQNFQALLTTQIIPDDPDQYALWHSTQTTTNLSKYNSQRIDKDLEDGRKTNDAKLRKERYLDFQRVLLDDAPASFLYFPKINIVYRSKVASMIEPVLRLQFP